MFKFDFKLREDESIDAFKENVDEEHCANIENVLECLDAKQVFCTEDILEKLDIARLNSKELVVGNVTINHLVAGYVLDDIKDHETHLDIGKAEEQHSDLIPGLYEGGAKIWECTGDLLQYLCRNFKRDEWNGKRVLDLGCGSGLLGIYANKCGAVVHFQDYNEDVLRKITIPNYLLNTDYGDVSNSHNECLKEVSQDVNFYAGDWSKYTELTMDEDKFDIIVTSETIYNPTNHKKLLNTFNNRLNRNGFVLLAAKTYYFGVGGGLRQFENLIIEDARFTSKLLWSSTDGVNREIIEIKFK